MDPIQDTTDADIDLSHLVDSTGPFTSLRRDSCHVCDARNGDGKKLSKCAGCNIALYCSKECQKAAWKMHRFVCRQTDSTRAIRQALEKPLPPDASEVPLVGLLGFHIFKNIHAWSIQTMCHAAVHLAADGRGAESFRREPMVMHFEANPSATPQAKPWNAWVLKKWRLETLEDLLKNNPSFAKKWPAMQASMEQEEAKHRAQFGSRYIGELLVLFNVEGTRSMITAGQPILQLREPEDLQDPTTRGAVEDLLSLCWGYTNNGVPLGQAPECPQLAIPGRTTKIKPEGGAPDAKKVWGWTKMLDGTKASPWNSNLYLDIFRRRGRKTNLPPLDLILLFYNLTAEEPCRSVTWGMYGNRPIAWDRRFLPNGQPIRYIG